jgi:hypothetical protein
MTIRVELLGRADDPLDPTPGRVMLAHAEHTLAELADAIDTAFGRWDLTPVHEFDIEGRRLLPGGDPEDPDVEDSEDVTLGDVALEVGTTFAYCFDLGERWDHDCRVEELDVEPDEETNEPVPVWGWGWLPDQYGRDSDEDDDDDDVFDDEESDTEVDFSTVAEAVPGWAVDPPADDLAAAAARLRTEAQLGLPPYDLLLGAAGLDSTTLPDDDAALWTRAAAGTIQPRVTSAVDGGAEGVWSTLEAADWAGLIIGLVRGDIGQSTEPEALAHLIAACPDVETDPLFGEDREAVVEALETVADWWQALGAVGEDRRLTALGRWGLPLALRQAWSEPAL